MQVFRRHVCMSRNSLVLAKSDRSYRFNNSSLYDTKCSPTLRHIHQLLAFFLSICLGLSGECFNGKYICASRTAGSSQRRRYQPVPEVSAQVEDKRPPVLAKVFPAPETLLTLGVVT